MTADYRGPASIRASTGSGGCGQPTAAAVLALGRVQRRSVRAVSEPSRDLPAGWLDRAGVARIWGVSAHYVTDAIRTGRLPAPDAYAGRTPLWRQETVEAALEHRRRPGPRPHTRPDDITGRHSGTGSTPRPTAAHREDTGNSDTQG